jgi:hypothetical protein
MKFYALTIVALGGAFANACIVVHAMFESCNSPTNFIMGDSKHIEAEMYDDGRLVCRGSGNKRFESDDWYHINCDSGYELDLNPSIRHVSFFPLGP